MPQLVIINRVHVIIKFPHAKEHGFCHPVRELANFQFSSYNNRMTITQTVEIPADRRLIIDVPREVPTGKARLTFTSMTEAAIEFADISNEEAMAAGDEILNKHLAAFKALAQ